MADRTLAELLVENSVDGFAAVDREYRYTLWNRAMEQFAGMAASEVLGRNALEVFPFLREHGIDVALGRALAGETVTIPAVPHDLADGSRRYHDRLYLPLREDAEIVGVLAIVRDVTAQRNAEDALRTKEAQLRVAVDGGGVGLWRWDTRADVVTWEDGMCAIFGLPGGAAPPDRAAYFAMIHAEDRARSAARIAAGVARGRWEDEYRILRPDGTERWVLAKASVVDGVALGAVLDVTDRREREARVRQTQKLEAVGQLTAGIAHNFNNMLMGILSSLEVAALRAPADLAPLLHDAEHSAQRAAQLVQQLMTYAGRNAPKERSVASVAELVERTVAFCRTTFPQGIAFQVRYDRTARVRVEPTQVEQALLNVLINARDAVAGVDTPRVTVEVDVVAEGAEELGERFGEYVRVRVGDSGPGMDGATAGRIFDPFFTTKPVGKGTGLGLSTTHAIVAEHGGFVVCDSAPSRGATFSLYLPRELAAVDAEPAREETFAVHGTETVLVVDDEPLIRRVVERMLAGAGFRTVLAASGDEALERLADGALASEVALVILDVSMPGLSGKELRNRLRAVAPHARVLYFSGYAFDAPDAGDVVLEKPTTEANLLRKVRETLDRPAPRPAG
ncbi:MAG TPA: PAS domain S-box protein [Polyangiaceae bacterium]|jgi:PAS domain S-box-containing protein